MSARSDKESPALPNVPLIHRPGTPAATHSLTRPPIVERKRLLVVDDEPPVLRLVTRILETENYDVAFADSGEAAARMVQDPQFGGIDVLVTDLMMPGLNGRQLAAIVRERNPAVRVLYITGFADTLFKGLQELGEGESFIEKPFGAEGLLEAARLLMFGHISESETAPDKRDEGKSEWQDGLRSRVVRLLRKLKMA
jgi:DNA-binding response OmpR family regulator